MPPSNSFGWPSVVAIVAPLSRCEGSSASRLSGACDIRSSGLVGSFRSGDALLDRADLLIGGEDDPLEGPEHVGYTTELRRTLDAPLQFLWLAFGRRHRRATLSLRGIQRFKAIGCLRHQVLRISGFLPIWRRAAGSCRSADRRRGRPARGARARRLHDRTEADSRCPPPIPLAGLRSSPSSRHSLVARDPALQGYRVLATSGPPD